MEAELVERENIPFRAIPAAGVHGVGLGALPGNLRQLTDGFFAARKLIARHRPQVIFFTGGYVAIPVAFAARFPPRGTPQPANLLYVPDIEPGLALKVLARFADRIALSAEESMRFFANPARLSVTGYPTRPDLGAWTAESARKALHLSPDFSTLLVFGGSKGARSINQALFPLLPQILPDLQVVHITGHLDWPQVASIQAALDPTIRPRYHAYAYLHTEMGAALAAADLVLSRAGASTLGEFPLFGLPAILVPYPHAWRYQEVNARYLESRGAAIVLQDAELPDRLLSLLQQLFSEPARREAMRRSMQSLARPQAPGDIAGLIFDLADAGSQGRN